MSSQTGLPAPGPRQALSWACAIFMLLASVCLAWIAFDNPNAIRLINSDTLLSSAWTEIIFHQHYSFHSFQLPRTTSIFPDLLVHGILQWATGSWRLASVVYGWMQLAALIAAAALIIRQITGAPLVLGAAVFAALVAIFFAVDPIPAEGNITRLRIVIEIVAHGGAFLLTLFGAALTCRILTREKVRADSWLLFALSAVAYFSDQLVMFEFGLPVFVALVFVNRQIDWRGAALRIVLPIASGFAAAHLLLSFINTQHMSLYHHLSGFAHLARDSSVGVVILWYLPAVVFFLPLLPERIRARILPDYARVPARFHWCLGASASVITLVVTVYLAYSDNGGFRYFYSLAWWPIILAAALITYPLSRLRYSGAFVSGMTLLFLLPQIPHTSPAVLRWTSPIADCLIAHRNEYGLNAGLATYWEARKTEASTNWTLLMEQTARDGSFYYWGNNRKRYQANAENFNFLVVKDLDPQLIKARFGSPEKTLQCQGSAIWIYPPGHMAAHLTQ